jgi:predicted GIY-YIG superfamily endonuclease
MLVPPTILIADFLNMSAATLPPTRGRGPWKLVHKEEFASSLEVRRRELEIKRWKSSRLIRALITTSVG